MRPGLMRVKLYAACIDYFSRKLIYRATCAYCFSFIGRRHLRGRLHVSSIFYPAALRPGDIKYGKALLAGRVLEAAQIDGFDWARHILAVKDDYAALYVSEQVKNWVRAKKFINPHSMQPHLIARRLMRWNMIWPFIKRRLNEKDAHIILTVARFQATFLARIIRYSADDETRIESACGLIFAWLWMGGTQADFKRAMAILRATLDKQILADGGHINRSPETGAYILADLCAVAHGLQMKKIMPPDWLLQKINHMRALLLFMRHADGALAAFHGGRIMRPTEINALLGKKNESAMSFAHKSGYQKLMGGQSCLILDAGKPPYPKVGRHAHFSPFAFEFSHNDERIFVNCGHVQHKYKKEHMALRDIGAHSTLSFGPMPHIFLKKGFCARQIGRSILVPDAWNIRLRRSDTQKGCWLDMEHNFFAEDYGVIHNRRLYLSEDGLDLRGEENLISPHKAQPSMDRVCHLCFHLHPHIEVMRWQGNVFLITRNGNGWRFHFADNMTADLTVRNSLYVTPYNEVQKTRKIVVSGRPQASVTRINWRLAYVEDAWQHYMESAKKEG